MRWSKPKVRREAEAAERRAQQERTRRQGGQLRSLKSELERLELVPQHDLAAELVRLEEEADRER
jgi:hypothetical protein